MNPKTAFLIFPHHLFADTTVIDKSCEIYLIEEYLFFNQYAFHKQKLLFHRATMRYYEAYLTTKGYTVHYIHAQQKEHDIRLLIADLVEKKVEVIHYYEVSDYWLSERITESCKVHQIQTTEHNSLLFFNTKNDLAAYFGNKKKYFQTDFYIQQRKKWKILIQPDGNPVGGKWTFDTENRLKYPKGKPIPRAVFPKKNEYYCEALTYVNTYYSKNYGILSDEIYYPNTHQDAENWLQQFFERRFAEFGPYEDALVLRASLLNHSLLSPLLNVGLLRPQQVIDSAIEYAAKNDIALNSLEGFIRQIIGWREFIRGVYEYQGVAERTRNFWKFEKALPSSFYTGTTGIQPLDETIKKVLRRGYAHHIERLMVLGNFTLLSEIHPDAVYQWFMEMFIDAYDWVMVPNVYGMSQFADGGLMSTKPYISGSNYLMKMSDYPKGDWQTDWDGLYWHFIDKHRAFFSKNPRLSMMVHMYDKMSIEKRNTHLENAEKRLSKE